MTLKELQNEVMKLSPKELEQFKVWFNQFDSDSWDYQIENDLVSGKLDSLADRVHNEYNAGKCKKI